MDLKRVNSLQYPVQIVLKICAKVFSRFHGSFPLRFSILGFRWWINCYPQKRETDSTRQREGVVGREVRRTTAKRDPGSPVRKLRLRNTLVSIPQQLAEENEREREKEKERQRETGKEKRGRRRRSVERNRMERPVYLDDSPARFARRPYETG